MKITKPEAQGGKCPVAPHPSGSVPDTNTKYLNNILSSVGDVVSTPMIFHLLC